MQLVSIESEEEQDELNKLLYHYGEDWSSISINVLKILNSCVLDSDYWWTSGSDQSVDDKWMWTATEESFTYTNWDRRAPNGGSFENFMQLQRKRRSPWIHGGSPKTRRFFWDDSEGIDREYSICEY